MVDEVAWGIGWGTEGDDVDVAEEKDEEQTSIGAIAECDEEDDDDDERGFTLSRAHSRRTSRAPSRAPSRTHSRSQSRAARPGLPNQSSTAFTAGGDGSSDDLFSPVEPEHAEQATTDSRTRASIEAAERRLHSRAQRSLSRAPIVPLAPILKRENSHGAGGTGLTLSMTGITVSRGMSRRSSPSRKSKSRSRAPSPTLGSTAAERFGKGGSVHDVQEVDEEGHAHEQASRPQGGWRGQATEDEEEDESAAMLSPVSESDFLVNSLMPLGFLPLAEPFRAPPPPTSASVERGRPKHKLYQSPPPPMRLPSVGFSEDDQMPTRTPSVAFDLPDERERQYETKKDQAEQTARERDVSRGRRAGARSGRQLQLQRSQQPSLDEVNMDVEGPNPDDPYLLDDTELLTQTGGVGARMDHTQLRSIDITPARSLSTSTGKAGSPLPLSADSSSSLAFMSFASSVTMHEAAEDMSPPYDSSSFTHTHNHSHADADARRGRSKASGSSSTAENVPSLLTFARCKCSPSSSSSPSAAAAHRSRGRRTESTPPAGFPDLVHSTKSAGYNLSNSKGHVIMANAKKRSPSRHGGRARIAAAAAAGHPEHHHHHHHHGAVDDARNSHSTVRDGTSAKALQQHQHQHQQQWRSKSRNTGATLHGHGHPHPPPTLVAAQESGAESLLMLKATEALPQASLTNAQGVMGSMFFDSMKSRGAMRVMGAAADLGVTTTGSCVGVAGCGSKKAGAGAGASIVVVTGPSMLRKSKSMGFEKKKEEAYLLRCV